MTDSVEVDWAGQWAGTWCGVVWGGEVWVAAGSLRRSQSSRSFLAATPAGWLVEASCSRAQMGSGLGWEARGALAKRLRPRAGCGARKAAGSAGGTGCLPAELDALGGCGLGQAASFAAGYSRAGLEAWAAVSIGSGLYGAALAAALMSQRP